MQLANRKIKVCFSILNIFLLELAIKQPYPYPVLRWTFGIKTRVN